MAKIDSLYTKLWDIETLGRAWHLARYDTRTDFVKDPFRHNDFAFRLDENLDSISRALQDEEYHPTPLITIDVPKSTLSVRPGSVVSIEDRIVLFAIAMLLVPKLDPKLPETVYSYRLKSKKDRRVLFKDMEILKFPFLKRTTIRHRVDIVEPWYGQWPKFMKHAAHVFEKEGYRFLTLSDISAYFENINLSLLRDTLLTYLPREQKIVNLLYSLLEYWTWRTMHGLQVERGIPQGNDVSSFIGNIYLLPLDKEFQKFGKKRDIRYFRYMDDVKVFSKEENVAREAVFVMNDVLRRLHLNIQGGKTMIKEDEDIQDELIDSRLDEVNQVLTELQKNRNPLSITEKKNLKDRLSQQYKKIKKRKRIVQGKDLRLYRRLMTIFTLLRSRYMVDNVFLQLAKNPDARLIDSAVRYFRHLPLSGKKISGHIMCFLESPTNLFPYQEAQMVMILRYLRSIPSSGISFAKKSLRLRKKHWYVRQQCALLIGNLPLSKKNLSALKRCYENERNPEIRKALVICLSQLERNALRDFLQELTFQNDKKLSSLGRMLISLLYNHKDAAIIEIKNLFRHFDEEVLMESFYKVEIMKCCTENRVKKELVKRLKAIRAPLKREHVKERVSRTLAFLENPTD